MRNKPKLLDLCCCAGGAGKGYHDAGFEVTGVDIKHQKNYPYRFIQAEALDYLLNHWKEYDVIHASPPCQRYSRETGAEYREQHTDLLEKIAPVLRTLGKPYIIENVTGARRHLHNPIMLCGSMFGLPIWRRRHFETSLNLQFAPASCDHSGIPILITGTTRRKGYRRQDTPVAIRKEAMQIDWMVTDELDEAIPPAYTEWLGTQFLRVMKGAA